MGKRPDVTTSNPSLPLLSGERFGILWAWRDGDFDGSELLNSRHLVLFN